jgi:ABC-type uncharacterized transport system substrate-binding protein
MRRREFIAGAGSAVAAWPVAAREQRQQVPLIGFLAPVQPPDDVLVAFKQGLREHGLVEGQNISIVYRLAAGIFTRLPTLAAELVDLKVALIVAWTTPAALAAKHATDAIPVVMVGVADPVATRIIDTPRAFKHGENFTLAGSLPLQRLIESRCELHNTRSPRSPLGPIKFQHLRQPPRHLQTH